MGKSKGYFFSKAYMGIPMATYLLSLAACVAESTPSKTSSTSQGSPTCGLSDCPPAIVVNPRTPPAVVGDPVTAPITTPVTVPGTAPVTDPTNAPANSSAATQAPSTVPATSTSTVATVPVYDPTVAAGGEKILFQSDASMTFGNFDPNSKRGLGIVEGPRVNLTPETDPLNENSVPTGTWFMNGGLNLMAGSTDASNIYHQNNLANDPAHAITWDGGAISGFHPTGPNLGAFQRGPFPQDFGTYAVQAQNGVFGMILHNSSNRNYEDFMSHVNHPVATLFGHRWNPDATDAPRPFSSAATAGAHRLKFALDLQVTNAVIPNDGAFHDTQVTLFFNFYNRVTHARLYYGAEVFDRRTSAVAGQPTSMQDQQIILDGREIDGVFKILGHPIILFPLKQRAGFDGVNASWDDPEYGYGAMSEGSSPMQSLAWQNGFKHFSFEVSQNNFLLALRDISKAVQERYSSQNLSYLHLEQYTENLDDWVVEEVTVDAEFTETNLATSMRTGGGSSMALAFTNMKVSVLNQQDACSSRVLHFSQADYRAQYRDVDNWIRNSFSVATTSDATKTSDYRALGFYLTHGKEGWWNPNACFSELRYLELHPDVAAAVRRGDYTSGWQHYLLWGKAYGYGI